LNEEKEIKKKKRKISKIESGVEAKVKEVNVKNISDLLQNDNDVGDNFGHCGDENKFKVSQLDF
jgi:hypothetical protein